MAVILLNVKSKCLREVALLVLVVEKNFAFWWNTHRWQLLSWLVCTFYGVWFPSSYFQNLYLQRGYAGSSDEHFKVCNCHSFFREMSLLNHITLNIFKLVFRPQLSCEILCRKQHSYELIAWLHPWVMYSYDELRGILRMNRAISYRVILRAYALQQARRRWIIFQVNTSKIRHLLGYRLFVFQDWLSLWLVELRLVVERDILSCCASHSVVVLNDAEHI